MVLNAETRYVFVFRVVGSATESDDDVMGYDLMKGKSELSKALRQAAREPNVWVEYVDYAGRSVEVRLRNQY